MQAHTIHIYLLAIHQEPLVWRKLYLTNAKRSLVSINRSIRDIRRYSIQSSNIVRSPFQRHSNVSVVLFLCHIHMAYRLIHFSIAHIPKLGIVHDDVLVELIGLPSPERSDSLSGSHRLAIRSLDFRHQSAEHGVGALVLDVGLHVHLGLRRGNLRCGNICAISCHMHIFEHMQPNIPVDTLAIIPSAALWISIVIAYGDDVRPRFQLVRDVKLEVEIAIRILSLAEVAIDIHLGIPIYALKLQDDALAVPSLVVVDGLAIPTTP